MIYDFSFHLAPGRAGAAGNPGAPGYRGLVGESVCFFSENESVFSKIALL